MSTRNKISPFCLIKAKGEKRQISFNATVIAERELGLVMSGRPWLCPLKCHRRKDPLATGQIFKGCTIWGSDAKITDTKNKKDLRHVTETPQL